MPSHVPSPSRVVYFSKQRPRNDAEFLNVLSGIKETLAAECDCGFWRVYVSSCYKGDREDQSDHDWKMIIGGSGRSGDPFRINKDGTFQGLDLVNTGSYRYPALPDDSDETNDNRNWVVRIYDHMYGEIQTVGPPNPKVKTCDKPPVAPPEPTPREVCCNCNTKCCPSVCIGYAYSDEEYMSMIAECNAIAFNRPCCKGCDPPKQPPKPPQSGSEWGDGGSLDYGGGGGGWGGGSGGGEGGWSGGGGIPYPTAPQLSPCGCGDLTDTAPSGDGYLAYNPNFYYPYPQCLKYPLQSFGVKYCGDCSKKESN